MKILSEFSKEVELEEVELYYYLIGVKCHILYIIIAFDIILEINDEKAWC